MKKIRIVSIILLILFATGSSIAIEFAVNTHRTNPYNRSKFRVKWDGKYIPGIFHISGLHRETQIMVYKSGNDKNGTVKQVPGKTTVQPLLLERGRTHDTSFEQWATQVWNNNSSTPQSEYKKDIIIELLNEAGQIVMAFKVYNCWPAQYSPVTEFDANSNEIAIESLELQYSGWERDTAITEPTEPSFTTP